MKAIKLFGLILLLNLAPILLALALGVYCGAFEPAYNCGGDCTPSPTPMTDAVMRWLPYLALFMALVSSWRALAKLAGASSGSVAPVALAFLFGYLSGTFIGIALVVGLAIGYAENGSHMYSGVPLGLTIITVCVVGIVFIFFWAVGGAYLGLVAWLIAWIARGRFRHNAK
jgi:hypothetical protein